MVLLASGPLIFCSAIQTPSGTTATALGGLFGGALKRLRVVAVRCGIGSRAQGRHRRSQKRAGRCSTDKEITSIQHQDHSLLRLVGQAEDTF